MLLAVAAEVVDGTTVTHAVEIVVGAVAARLFGVVDFVTFTGAEVARVIRPRIGLFDNLFRDTVDHFHDLLSLDGDQLLLLDLLGELLLGDFRSNLGQLALVVLHELQDVSLGETGSQILLGLTGGILLNHALFGATKLLGERLGEVDLIGEGLHTTDRADGEDILTVR